MTRGLVLGQRSLARGPLASAGPAQISSQRWPSADPALAPPCNRSCPSTAGCSCEDNEHRCLDKDVVLELKDTGRYVCYAKANQTWFALSVYVAKGEEEEEEGGEHENNSVGGEEGYGSSSSRDGAGVAQPGRHGRLVEPITRATEAGRSTQGGQLQPQGGTTTWEEVARLAGQVCRGWGALTTEERMQDTMTILHLVRQGRRWLDAVKRTSNWELQSMAESKAAEAEQAALLALSYPNHHQAAGQIQHVQHHAEACVGAEAIALEVTLNTGESEQASEGVHPADAISLAAGGEEAAPAGDRGWLQTGGHPAMRARSILRHLLPFTGGEVRQQVQAALGALDEWSTELWGGELLAIEDTLGNSGEEMHPPPPPPTHHAEGTGRGTDGGDGGRGRGHVEEHRELPPPEEELHDRDNGRDTETEICDLEGGVEGGRCNALPTTPGAGGPSTQATVPWNPPPPLSYTLTPAQFEGPVRRYRGVEQPTYSNRYVMQDCFDSTACPSLWCDESTAKMCLFSSVGPWVPGGRGHGGHGMERAERAKGAGSVVVGAMWDHGAMSHGCQGVEGMGAMRWNGRCTGPFGDICVPRDAVCPQFCQGQNVCNVDNFDDQGRILGSSTVCVSKNEACPCGDKAVRCDEGHCVPESEGCQTCDLLTHRWCYALSFTIDGNYNPAIPTAESCVPFSQPCQCGENAQVCNWTDASGRQQQECLPAADSCPLVCVGNKTCVIVDYNLGGEIGAVREECQSSSDEDCPCGSNAISCIDVGKDSYCLPRPGRCPVVCGEDEEPCYRPGYDAEGNHLPPEETCVRKGLTCGCGQNSFACDTDGNLTQCLPIIGGYCPQCLAGEVECPHVLNFQPNGTQVEGWVEPIRNCASSLLDCPCGREAQMCDSLGRCIFKGAACCMYDQKLCVLTDYMPDGHLTGYREICWLLTEPCPCGANTHRCPGTEVCLPESIKEAICPCDPWQKTCELTEYSETGVPETSWKLCVDQEKPCPCGRNSLRCLDPLENRTTCIAKVTSGIANACPAPCSINDLARGSQTCVQIDHVSETVQITRVSCQPWGDCSAGASMKICPSGATVPVWQQCQLGRQARPNVTSEILEISRMILQMSMIRADAHAALASAELQLRYMVEIPTETLTALSLVGRTLTFTISGPGKQSSTRRLQEISSAAAWDDPSDLTGRLREEVMRRSSSALHALDRIGTFSAGISIDTQRYTLEPLHAPDPLSNSPKTWEGPGVTLVAVLVLASIATICLSCLCIRRARALCSKSHSKTALKDSTAQEDAHVPAQRPPTPVSFEEDLTPTPSQRVHLLVSGRFNSCQKMRYMQRVKELLDSQGVPTYMVDAGGCGNAGPRPGGPRDLRYLRDRGLHTRGFHTR
ncbi:PRY3 [Symbiodinium natans]|uniref:PRY3 protein n=1 Tax=Symbiodinium natans TaxID=878477 RepID=A0A812PG66_9DINO|nr:PRY3 [Symbiodinium natans]